MGWTTRPLPRQWPASNQFNDLDARIAQRAVKSSQQTVPYIHCSPVYLESESDFPERRRANPDDVIFISPDSNRLCRAQTALAIQRPPDPASECPR